MLDPGSLLDQFVVRKCENETYQVTRLSSAGCWRYWQRNSGRKPRRARSWINKGNLNASCFNSHLDSSAINLNWCGGRVGLVLGALAFQQCGSGSISAPGVICGMSLLVLFSLFFSRVLRFSLLIKNQHWTWFDLLNNYCEIVIGQCWFAAEL